MAQNAKCRLHCRIDARLNNGFRPISPTSVEKSHPNGAYNRFYLHLNLRPNRCDKGHDQYRQRLAAVVIKKNSNTWYVSICLPDQEKTGHYSRRSRSFASESEAKRFAAAKIAAGVDVSAGTLNPVTPRRTVAPSEIGEWLSEETN